MNLSIKEMFRAAWAVFTKQVWVFIGAAAFIGAVSFVFNKIGGNGKDLQSFVIGVVTAVALWWLYIGFIRMALTASAGGAIHFKSLFAEQWPTLLQFAIATILTGLIVGIGLILIIVPGVMAQVGLLFGAFFVVDKGMKGIDAMKASWNLTKGHKWQIFYAFLVLTLLNPAGAAISGTGLLITVPLTALSLAHPYRELEKGVSITPTTKSNLQTKNAREGIFCFLSHRSGLN